MKALKAFAKHRAVLLVPKPAGDVHDALGVDPHQVAVVGQVMDRAQGKPVHYGRDATRVCVLDDVGRLHQGGFAQRQTVHRWRYARKTFWRKRC